MSTVPPVPGDNYVQSFARGLAVLRSFGADAPAQTLTEVADRTGLTRAGARRILLTLLHLGYVDADGRQFRLTPKVLDLGYAYLSSLPLWSQAQPLLADLSQSVRHSCSAAVLEGADIVYVVRLSAQRTMSINLGIGSRLPAYCTSMGRVLLAGLPPDQVRARLGHAALLKLTSHTEVDQERLLDIIATVRQKGWSLVSEELEHGLISIAAPVVDRTGNTVAAINISAQTGTTTAQRLIDDSLPKLLATAQHVSALMRLQN